MRGGDRRSGWKGGGNQRCRDIAGAEPLATCLSVSSALSSTSSIAASMVMDTSIVVSGRLRGRCTPDDGGELARFNGNSWVAKES